MDAHDKGWPFDIPAVRQLQEQGLALTHPVTFLVGENGVGKSTLLEAVAEAYRIDVRGGHAGRRYGSRLPRGVLGQSLVLHFTPTVSTVDRRRHGYFFRSETALGVLEFMSNHGVSGYGNAHLGEVSHGEGTLQVARGRFTTAGLYILDEPESGLSFQSSLELIQMLKGLVSSGGQVICATHSPVLCSMPNAEVIELGSDGLKSVRWDQLKLVKDWQDYLASPERFLKQLDLQSVS